MRVGAVCVWGVVVTQLLAKREGVERMGLIASLAALSSQRIWPPPYHGFGTREKTTTLTPNLSHA